MDQDLPRSVGFWGAAAISVGIMIGSGIFRTPTSIAMELSSPALILILWGVGGLLSLFGALTCAELACMYPHSGGVYVFLREGWGRGAAFVFGWTYMLVTKPLAAAGIAIVFGEHVNKLLGVDWDPRLSTIFLIVALTVVNVRGVRLGAGVALFFTVIKALALAAIVTLALALVKGSGENLQPQEGPSYRWLALAPVMAAILWTYDGWSDVGAIAGEVKEPQRNLPRAFLWAVGVVTALYLAVNAVYMWMMPLAEMRGVPTVAPTVMERLIGPAAGVIVTLIVIVSTAGSTHGSILTGARVTFAQARDGLLFTPLARMHPTFKTPDTALWVQMGLSCLAAWFVGTFEKLAGGFVFTMWIFYGLAAASIFVFRLKRPDAQRPFRCPGYPAVPALFVLAAATMTGLAIAESPRDTLPWLGILAAGFPAYWVWRRLRRV
ncbi:MAG: amino acid permease [Phycisphaerae bacterium]|nr:amino acid permease [Phycisphaerae bacterium]